MDIYFQQHIVRSSGQISWVRPRPTWRRFQETNQGSHQIQQPGRSRGRGTPSKLKKQLWHVCYLSLDRCVWGGHPYTHKTDFIPIGGIFCQWQHLLILARSQHNESPEKNHLFVFLGVTWLQTSRYVENCSWVFSVLEVIEEWMKRPEK